MPKGHLFPELFPVGRFELFPILSELFPELFPVGFRAALSCGRGLEPEHVVANSDALTDHVFGDGIVQGALVCLPGVVSGLYLIALPCRVADLEPSPHLALVDNVFGGPRAWRPKRRPALGQCRPHGVNKYWCGDVPPSAPPLLPCRCGGVRRRDDQGRKNLTPDIFADLDQLGLTAKSRSLPAHRAW